MTDVHARVTELLPWFVNGTLTDSERELVEAHTRTCLPCRRAVTEERALYCAVQTSDVPSAAERGLDSLLARIDGRERHAPKTCRPGIFRPTINTGWIAVAAGVSIVILIAALQLRPATFEPTGPAADAAYSALSDSAPGAATRIDVVFVAEPDAASLQRFADDLGATAVAGPSELGRYTFTLPAGADPDAVLQDVRQSPLVRLAARAFIEAEAE